MKCPKCGYLGFEQSERCRNCGYTFSLAETPEKPGADLPLREGEMLGPLGDFDLGEAARPAPTPRSARRRIESEFDPHVTPAPASLAQDLPLFVAEPGEEDRPLVVPSAPTPPLAVRRASPPVARPRQRVTPRDPEAQMAAALPLPEPTPAEPTAAAVTTDAAPGDTAPVGSRLVAGIVDWSILLFVDAVVLYFTLRVCRLSVADVRALPAWPLGLFFLMFDGGYLALLTAAGGQTIGKMALRVKVVGETGQGPTLAGAFLRTLALLLCTVPAGLGLVPALLGSRRGLHDLLAGTRVVRSSID